MAKQRKRLKGLSSYYMENIGMGELAFREAYLRATKETLDNFGLDKYTVERLQGMISLLEQWALIEEEQQK